MQRNELLIIDDDADWLKFAVRYFSVSGYDVRSASTGADGLVLARHRRPEAILLDYHLGAVSGGKICADIRTDPGLKTLPVIMISADPTVEENAYFNYKADAFVLKGEKLTNALGVIEAVLRRVQWERGVLEKEELRLETANLGVFRGPELLARLSLEQFRFLYILMEKSPAFVGEDEALKFVFDEDRVPEKFDALRGLANRLRAKLGRRLGRRIKSAEGLGWTYLPPAADPRAAAGSGQKKTP